MVELARQGYTRQEILDALHGKTGVRRVSFRYDVIRGGAVVRQVKATGSVSLNRFAEIERTANFTLREELDWLHEEIKPYMLLDMAQKQTGGRLQIMPCSVFDALNLTCDAFDALNITGSDLDAGYVKAAGGSMFESWDDRDGMGWAWDKWDAIPSDWNDLDAGRVVLPDKVEFPLGVFIPSSPARSSSNGATVYEVEAFDRTVILREDSIYEPLFIAKDTPYLDAVQSILLSAGITDVFVEDEDETLLRTDREFEVGTKKLSIINTLLGEINYNKIRCNADGVFVISRYREPSLDRVDYTYKADQLSIIGRDTASDLDLYGVPNVFVAVCSNPELEIDYRSVWINDSPANKLSTVSRGRIITSEIYQPEVIASQQALDDYIRRIAWNANQVYEQLEFATALMPIHESADSLQIQHPDVSGIFVESAWDMELDAQALMQHRARRLVQV